MSRTKERSAEVYESFVCRCGDDEQREHKHATIEEERRRAARLLEVDADDDAALFDNIVMSLHWNYDACIDSILSDQWSAVCSSRYKNDFGTFIQCDSPFDGMVATWLAYYDKFGDPDVQSDDTASEAAG